MMQTTHSKTLRIGLVLSSVPGYSETFFRNKIKGLQDYGYEVVLFVDYYKKKDVDFPCKVVAAKNFNGNFLQTVFDSLRMLLHALFLQPKRSFKLYQLDKAYGVVFKTRLKNLILHQFLLTENLDWLHFGFGMLAVGREHVAEAIGAQMAVSFRGYDLYLSPLKHPGCYDVLFKTKTRYHVLSEQMRQTLLGYHIPTNAIEVITPAIDIKFFQSQKLHDVNSVIHIVTVARLHWRKGLEYTLEALSLLKHADVPFNFSVIGEGDQLERLIFAAHQLGISDQVHFLGKLSQEDVKTHLEQSDVYLQYSIQEGFCNSVLEAQAMGLLCIVSNAEGLDENVLDGITGWVVPKRQPQLLAQKIMEVFNLPKEAQDTIRNAAVGRVRDEFDLEAQNEKFGKFYGKK